MPLITKTPSEIKAGYLRTLKAGLRDLGVVNPNVAAGSDYDVQGEAIGNEVSAINNNVVVQSDALMLDTATGTDLDRQLAIAGLSRRAAGAGAGAVTLVATASTSVSTASELISATGNVYTVTIGGTYANGAVIELAAKTPGTGSNLAAGQILTWLSPPAFSQSTATVYRAITGGVDAEDDSTARARLISRKQAPPQSGNWNHIAEIAEDSDPVVQKAFIYPCAGGPGTAHVAVAGYPSAVSKSREIEANKVTAVIAPTIEGNLPESQETTITTVDDVPCDVSIELSLPLAVNTSSSSAAGLGGGWMNATVWPPVSDAFQFVAVSAVTDSTHFSVVAPLSTAPTPGVTKIQWIDQATKLVRRATITASTGTGPYALTLDTPFVGIAVGDWIFPAATNMQTYVDAAYAYFAQLGPGEKQLSPAFGLRSFRKPLPQTAFPYSIDGRMLKAINNSSDEVQTSDFLYRSYGAADPDAVTGIISPALPSAVTDPPKIFVPRQIGFYYRNG